MLGCSAGGGAASSMVGCSEGFCATAEVSNGSSALKGARLNVGGGSAPELSGDVEATASGGAKALTACAPANAGSNKAAAANAARTTRFVQPTVEPIPDEPMLSLP